MTIHSLETTSGSYYTTDQRFKNRPYSSALVVDVIKEWTPACDGDKLHYECRFPDGIIHKVYDPQRVIFKPDTTS